MSKKSFVLGMISGFAVLFGLAYLGVEIYSPWSCEVDDAILVMLTWIVTIGIYDVVGYAKKAIDKYAPLAINKIQELKKLYAERRAKKAA